MKMRIGRDTLEIEVSYFAEYPRSEDGTCALCLGDPCNDTPIEGSPISKFYKANPSACTCPVCNGRPS
jgi:hypothetical protein